jgi:hypothetical protein
LPITFHELSDEIITAINGHPSMLLFSKEYSLFGPSFHNNPGGWGTVSSIKGGPSLEFLLLKERTTEKKTVLGHCMVGHYFRHENPITGESFDATPELRTAYQRLVRLVKKYVARRYTTWMIYVKGVRTRVESPFWLSKSALGDIEAGKTGIILHGDDWRSGSDFRIEK